MVGSSARPARLSQSVLVEMPSVIPVSESSTFPRNTKQPTVMAHAYSNVIMDKIEEAVKSGLVGNEDDDW